MAVMGGPQGFASLTMRPGPAFVSTPYASVAAAHLAIQGALGALVERERSGLGQQVDVTLARALVAYDTWNWLLHVLAERYSQAFTAGSAIDAERLIPNTPMFFRLLVGLSKDGQWLQFSQTTDRLWHAFLRACDLDPDDADVLAMEDAEEAEVRVRFWEILLAAVRRRTADEWAAVFDADPNVWADVYRGGPATLEHQQLVADGRVGYSASGTRVPAGLALARGWTVDPTVPPPDLGADAAGSRSCSPRRRTATSRTAPATARRCPRARRHHDRRDRLVLRRALRRDAARRAGCPRRQDRDGGGRRDPPPHAVPRAVGDQGAPGQGVGPARPGRGRRARRHGRARAPGRRRAPDASGVAWSTGSARLPTTSWR